MTRKLLTTLALASLLAAWVISFNPTGIPVVAQLNAALYTLWLPRMTPAQTDPRIVIIDIDEESLRDFGRWPWSRTQLATLVRQLTQTDAATIGLDILLPEPAADDPTLRHALSDPRVVTASAWAIVEHPHNSWPLTTRGLQPSPSLGQVSQGHITPIYSADGQIRLLPPVICQPETCHPALAARMLTQLTGQPLQQDTRGLWQQICSGHLCQPLDQKRQLRIPYRKGIHFRHISASQVISGKAAIAPGSLVLVGTSATGLGDLVSTPLSTRTPGVEVHAHLLSGWLDNQHLYTIEQAHWINASGSTLILLTALYTGLRRNTRGRQWVALAVITALLPLAAWFSPYWLSPLPMLWSLACAITLGLLGRLITQHEDKLRLSHAFAHYIPDTVMTRLLVSGTSLDQLDACRSEVSVLFVDIRGFTQMTERLGADAVVQLTRQVFTELTTLIHASEGTLDKFIGDAAMAFWGAPTPQADHADRALDCAIHILRALPAINASLTQQGLPPVNLTLGLDAGSVISGNLGSQQRRAYTVIGNAVNRAARLQALACELNHPLLAGERLVDHLTNPSRLTLAGSYTLKGFSTPLPVYSPADSMLNMTLK